MADPRSGLSTLVDLDATPPNARVIGIAWDSPFRGSDLRVGDRIVGVGGKAVLRPADAPARQALQSSLPGQYNEPQTFAALGLDVGSTLVLRIRRRAPEQGWIELDVGAPLFEQRAYRNADNREVLGDGGPVTMDSDGFGSGGWGGWSDSMAALLSRMLDRDQHTGTFVTRFEAKSLRETHGESVAFAAKTYPGAWSAALKADYDAALALNEGRLVSLPANALDFRRRGEELAAEIRTQAQADWDAFQAAHAAEIVPAFPAVNPVQGRVDAVTGKLVVLPPLGNRDWIAEGGHGWFAAGGDGWYFLDAEAEPAQAMLTAQRRYTKMVDPNIAAQWQFVARITGEPRLTVVGERAHFGLVAEPVAALVGGAMFVDLTQRKATQVPFTGEAGLLDETPDLPPDDAAPATVLAALVGAVKTGDLALWRALHAGWSIERRNDAEGRERLIVHPCAAAPDESMYELSRRSVMGRVLDAQVAWVDDPFVLVDGKRFEGAMAIDEVTLWLDHVGEFDGERRVFADVTVRPRWTLQRVDNGPWRIAEAQPI